MRRALLGIGIAILLTPLATSAGEHFERGDALYRSGAHGFGHTGLYIDWKSREEPSNRTFHRIVDAITEGIDSVVSRDFKTFCSGGAFWSVRRWRHRLSAAQRRRVTNTAMSIAEDGAEYNFFFGYKNPLGDNPSFRCDGLVEYCYELALGHPWLPGLNGGIVMNDTWFSMSPLTQMIHLLSENQARLDTLRIMTPYRKDTLSDSVWTLVYIHDSDYGSGVEKVQLWVDDDTANGLKETVTEDIWNSAYFNWDSRTVRNGRHVLYATGFDQAGNHATDSITVFVYNSIPRVTRTYPDDTQPAVPPDTTIWIEFNKRMDSTSVENAILFDPNAVIHMSWDDSSRLLFIEPELGLNDCSEYTLIISDSARDSQGRGLDGDGDGESGGEFRLTFRTGPPRIEIKVEPPVSHVNQGEIAVHGIFVRNLSKNTISGELCANGSAFGWKLDPAALSSHFLLEPNSVHSESIYVKNISAVGPIEIEIGVNLQGCKRKSEIYSWVAGDHIMDHPDETYDISDRLYSSPWLVDTKSPVGILLSGWGDGLGHLLGAYKIRTTIVKPDMTLLNEPQRDIADLKVLLAGSAGLAGLGTGPHFRERLDDFVYKGGTLIVLSQQNGEDFECLPGFGLKAKGWNQDQSCFWKASYMEQWHPVLSGQTKAILTCSVDGYFSAWPESSELILRRTASTMPCLLTYEHGEGTVLVASLFSDWGLGHSQTDAAERRLLRDAVTWAMDTNSEIPTCAPEEAINLSPELRNCSKRAASSALLEILSPSRDTLDVSTIRLTPPLQPGKTRSLSIVLPGQSELGIYPLYATLQDHEGMPTNGPSLFARFLVKKEIDYKGHKPGGLSIWATTETEFVTANSEVEYEVHISNNEKKAFEGKLMIGVHENRGRWWALVDSITDINLPSDSILKPQYFDTLDLPTSTYFGVYEPDTHCRTKFFNDAISRSQKGIWVGLPRCELVLETGRDTASAGDSLAVRIRVSNRLPMKYKADLRIELLDPEHQVISRKVVSLKVDDIFGAFDSTSFFIPRLSLPGIYSLEAICVFDSITLAKTRTYFVIPEPDLTAHIEIPDAVGDREPIELHLMNIGGKPDSGGVVEATLETPEGDTAWQEQYVFDSMELGDSALVNLWPKPDKLLFGTYALRLTILHEGTPLISSLELLSILVPHLSLRPLKPRAGNHVNLTLLAQNPGHFVIDAKADLEASDFYKASKNLRLRPGRTDTVNFSTNLPDTLSPGYYPVVATISSQDTIQVETNLFLAKPALSMSAGRQGVCAGDSVLIMIRNDGGTLCVPRLQTVLTDHYNTEIFASDSIFCIQPSAECTLFIHIPHQARSGDYVLELSATDTLMRTSGLWQRKVSVEGVYCTLDVWTECEAYPPDEPINLYSSLANDSIGFHATVHSNIAKDRASFEVLTLDPADSTNKHLGCRVYEGSVEIALHSAWFETSFTFSDGPSLPSYIAVDRNGLIYAADYFHSRIFKLTPEGRIIKNWGKPGHNDGEFNGLWGLTVDGSGYVYVADFHNFRIQKFNTDGQFITKWDLDGRPWDICVDDSGYVYAVDYSRSKIQKFTSDGGFVTEWGSEGTGEGQFKSPWGIGTDGTLIYVADTYNHRIQVFTPNGEFLRKWGKYGYDEGDLVYPSDVALSPDGFVYTGEYGPSVNKFTKEGEFISRFIPHGQYPPSWSIALTDEKTLLSCGYDYLIHRYSIGVKGSIITEPEAIEGAEKAVAFIPSQHLNNGIISYQYDVGAGWQPIHRLTKESLMGSTISFKAILERGAQTDPSPRLQSLSLLYLANSPDSAFWQDSVDVSVVADTTIILDTTAHIDVDPGKLYLNSRLTNSLTQTVATSAHPFFICSGNLLLSLSTHKAAYRPHEEVVLTAKLGNSSDHEIEGIKFDLSTGKGTLLIDTLSLGPSQWDTLTATTSAESSFAVLASAISPDADSAVIVERIEVMAPSFFAEVCAPQFASHQPFDATFTLTNTCLHTLRLDIEGTVRDSVLFCESVALEPYTFYETTCSLQLAQAESIHLAVVGDVDTCISRLIRFGESGTLVPRVQKEYDSSQQRVSFEILNTSIFDLEYSAPIIAYDSVGSLVAADTLTGFIPPREYQTQDLTYNLPDGIYRLEYRLLCSCRNELESGDAILNVGKPYSGRIDSVLICADNSLPCGTMTVQTQVRNTGTRKLSGRVSVTCPFYGASKPIELKPGETKPCLFSIDSSPPKGHYTLTSSLGRLGQVLDALRSDFELAPSYILDAPDTLFCQIGELAICPVSVTNTGKASGTDAVRLDFPPVMEDSHSICIDPCSTHRDSFGFLIPPDFETGNYAGLLSVGDSQRDIVFQVLGLQINVLAQLDRKIYSKSDTAFLNLHVENLTEVHIDLDVRINSGNLEREDSCSLEGSDTTNLLYQMPVEEAGGRIFYGFYLQSGRAIHLGAVYLRTREDTAYVYTEKQVYESGDSAMAVVEAEIAGAIFSKIFGEYTPKDSLTVSPPGTTFSFLIPEEIATGTYSIDYVFASSNKPEVRITGHHLFDVVGYTVRILRTVIDRMKYHVGDKLKATHTVKCDRGFRGLLQAWIRDSRGDYATCYKEYRTLREGQNRLETEGTVNSQKHGPGALLYGIFKPKPGNEYALLLAAGMKGIDIEPQDTIPPEFVWFSADPDTFNPLKGESTQLSLLLSESCSVCEVRLINEHGRQVARWSMREIPAAEYKLRWDAKDSPAGSYSAFSWASDFAQNASDTAQVDLFVAADTVSPVTTVGIGLPSFGQSPTYLTSRTLLSLDAHDDITGVDRTEYSVLPSPSHRHPLWHLYDEPFTIGTPDGPHSLRYRSIDKAGNVEKTRETDLATDNTPPTVCFVLGEPHRPGIITYISPEAEVRISVEDSGCGIQHATYAVDEQSSMRFLDKATFRVRDEGFHSIKSVAVDNLDNTVNDSLAVAVDSTAPLCNLQIGQPSYPLDQGVLITSSTPITVAASDLLSNGVASGVAHIEYFLYRENFLVPDSSVSFFLTGEDGEYVIRYSATDRVDNKCNPGTTRLVLDNTPPLCTIDLPYDSTLVNRTISLIGNAQDPHFHSYQIECGTGLDPVEWAKDGPPIFRRVDNSLLKQFNTQLLPSATPFLLRITARDLLNNISRDTVLLQTGHLLASDTLPMPQTRGIDATSNSIYISTEQGIFRTTPQLTPPEPIYNLEDLRNVVSVPDGSLLFCSMTQLLKANPPNQPELFVDGLKMANGLDLDSEYNAYVTEASHDNYGGEILRFDMAGRQTLRIGNLRRPLDVAVDDSLSIYVTDTDRHLVRKFNRRGKELLDFGGFGTTPGKMAYPSGVALEPNGYIWISDTGNGRVQLFDPLGNRLYDFELPSSNSRGEAEPLDLDLRGSSSIYVVDKLSQWILHLVKPPLVDPNMQLAAHAQSSAPRLLIRNPINIPNPFNPSKEKTVLRFSTTKDGRARILIYDLAGRPVRTFDFFCTEGSNEAAWDGRNEVGVTADNGVYYFKIVVESAGESAAAFGKIAVLR